MQNAKNTKGILNPSHSSLLSTSSSGGTHCCRGACDNGRLKCIMCLINTNAITNTPFERLYRRTRCDEPVLLYDQPGYLDCRTVCMWINARLKVQTNYRLTACRYMQTVSLALVCVFVCVNECALMLFCMFVGVSVCLCWGAGSEVPRSLILNQ